MIDIKFKLNEFATLRDKLLDDLNNEAFALILAKTNKIDDYEVITVVDILYPTKKQYKQRNLTFLNVEDDFFIDALKDLTSRYDVDTIIDIHTHPFSKKHVAFSGTDDQDEINFKKFLDENFENIHYGSIVLSQEEYSARKWLTRNGNIFPKKAMVKTQLPYENIDSSDFKSINNTVDEDMFNRGILALGISTLKDIVSNQTITIIGSGGTGSVIAESLVHMGFNNLNIIDNDKLEISNMNRIVGAYYQDAVEERYKVDTLSKHLKKINPNLQINSYKNDVYDKEMEIVLAKASWIIIATDNHSSRFKSQEIAFKYYVPFISVGVNITVENNKIIDESGEIITIRMGDNVCLKCLKRIKDINIAQERATAGEDISEALVKKGYVEGKDIKEPAVKTLNSIIGQMTVDILVNQYTQRLQHQTILVYERNIAPTIYEDKDSVKNRVLNCNICSL